MNYRTFPKLPDIKISQFGMGLMRLPVIEGDYSKIDYEKANEMVEAAIAGGVNYFDTAEPYHGGDSEAFASKHIVPRLKKEGLHLATKLPQWKAESYDDYEKILNGQLEKLGLEQIEFYLVHAFGNESWPKHKELGIIDFMKSAVADGRIKYPCFSFHGNYDTFVDIINSWDGWVFCQLQLNYIDTEWQAGVKGMEYAHSKDVGVVIMEPLKGGILANDIPPETEAKLKELDLSPVDVAMRWCYNHNEPTVVLSGVSTLEQTKGQLEIAKDAEPGCLSAKEKEALEFATKKFNLVPCSGCEYCQPCPQGIKIPQIISMYNGLVSFGKEKAKEDYKKLVEKGEGADICTECGACEAICPQSIEIIKVIQEAHELMG